MDLYELTGRHEDNDVYRQVVTSNGIRHYDFLCSMIEAALAIERPMLSQSIIKAINFHAIVGLHHEAGRYRTHPVQVGEYKPPLHYRVPSLMDDFVNLVNWRWQAGDSIDLAAYALWRINHIHPFVNGNGRTARAVSYFILCVKSGGLLPGNTILPELLRTEPARTQYVAALRQVDISGQENLGQLVALIRRLVIEQIEGAYANEP